MKVCFVADNSVDMTGGAQSLLALMLSLKGKGVIPILLGHQDSEQLRIASSYEIRTKIIKTKIFVYPKNTNKIIVYAKSLIKRIYNYFKRPAIKKFFLEEGIELVHLNSVLSSIECAAVANKMEIPYVWHIREYIDADHGRCIVPSNYYKHLMQKSNALITISKDVQLYWSTKLGEECRLVYNGFDVKKYYYDGIYRLSSNNVNCIIVGRLNENKRQKDAIDAIKILSQKGINNIRLTIVGYRRGRAYDEYIREYIDSQQLQSIVELKNFTNDIRDNYRQNDIGLMCSTREAFGRVTIEYMLSGLLCIGSNTGGTLELIENGSTGLLYEMGNAEDLANKIEWVLNNRQDSKRILQNGQKKAMDKFSIERTAHNVYSIYQKVLKNEQ